MRSPLEDTHKGIALGSTVFIEDIERRIRSIGPKREIRETKFKETFGAAEIINKIVEVFDIKKEEIFRKRRSNILRQLALYLIKKYSSLSLKEIGGLFDIDYTAVSMAVKRYENKIKRDNKTLTMKTTVINALRKKFM
jgi:chromosomal replication initiation ATPase DnaA